MEIDGKCIHIYSAIDWLLNSREINDRTYLLKSLKISGNETFSLIFADFLEIFLGDIENIFVPLQKIYQTIQQ